ncbi:MAG: hypothetical protein L3J71_05660 [Victivallaceae bacterium]|nr:hypothetical protein [Victivallaceae bacterium]
MDKILPRLESVTAQLDTIGAVADANARHIDKVDEFFDPQVHGDCLIDDKLTQQRYSFRYHEQQPGSWQAKQQWVDRQDYWEWTLEIDHLHGDQRELSVELQLPHPIFPGKLGSGHSKWQLWLPIAQESLGSDYGLRKVHFCQCLDEKTDVPFPLCSLFHNAADVSLGLSYLLPPDQNWYTDFEVDQRNWMTKITFKYLGLTEHGSIKLRLWCFSHAGDWRPAVGWVREKFPELLGPVAGQEKLEGNMAYTIPMIPEKRISDWSQQMHLRWNELFYCRNFGDYFPAEPFDSNHFKTTEHPEWSVDNLNYDDINRYIDMCHKHEVKVMPYFNIAECESEIARTKFPESIAKFFNGNEKIPWIYYDRKNYNVCMNSDPAYPWFDFVMGQFEQLLKRCPGIDGFFFDQMNYGWIDTAHFDGETFFNNQPAYNMGNMYLRALKKMREIFPRPRINGIGNGIVRWQMMEYLDGVMAEGDPDTLGRFSFLAPERPTICLAEGENAFQNALYYGSWVHVSPYYRYPTTEPLPEDAIKLFAAYTPLMKLLEGRKMVYTPNPLRVEFTADNLYKTSLLNSKEKIKANIFRTAQGGYAIVILALPKGMTLTDSYLSLTVRVNLPENKILRQAAVFTVENRESTLAETTLTQNGELEIKIPKHGAATLVVLSDS